MKRSRRRKPSPKPSTRRLIRASERRPSWLPIGTRLLAIVVLSIGALLFTSSMQSAIGQQFRQTNPGNRAGQFTPQAYNGQSFQNGFNNTNSQGGIPTMPAAAMTPDGQAGAGLTGAGLTGAGLTGAGLTGAGEDAAAESEGAAWQMPAFVAKIAQGGWLMIPLGICSLIVLTLSFERMIALRRSRVIPRPFVRRFTECVEDGQLSHEEATELCEEFDCPVAEVFQAAVRRWGRPMFEVEQAVMDAGDRVADGLKRFLRVFHAISNVAPLLGLLGTVLGMIQAFEVISSQESMGRPEMLASGISVALITTAGGLAVAIPAYLAYMYFSSKSDRYLGEIDKLCQRVVDCISAEGLETSGSSRSRKKRAA